MEIEKMKGVAYTKTSTSLWSKGPPSERHIALYSLRRLQENGVRHGKRSLLMTCGTCADPVEPLLLGYFTKETQL